MIPLSTNRFYTHEIRPSVLNVDLIPIRMGYVVRCSNLEAVYTNDQTYIKGNGELIKLEEMTSETIEQLRSSYYEENKSEKMVEYGKIHFNLLNFIKVRMTGISEFIKITFRWRKMFFRN